MWSSFAPSTRDTIISHLPEICLDSPNIVKNCSSILKKMVSPWTLTQILLLSWFTYFIKKQEPGSMLFWKTRNVMKMEDTAKSHNKNSPLELRVQRRFLWTSFVLGDAVVFTTLTIHIYSLQVSSIHPSFIHWILPSCNNYQAPDLWPGWEE